MKKIIVVCLIVILSIGNICYAQVAGHDHDASVYYDGPGRAEQDKVHNPVEQCSRHREHRHHKRHRQHDNDDSDDIIKGILILGVLKEIID